ncbi:hypothetical protein EVAR_54800_1 [Eumeta japonica]|uniref:Uncharacterized protein n=1 Tax=Eumeta variegata TaxID=151549 RepID=A0A4C1XZD4_EUMVA|nr:hypothetical protein EVAR_54800_1 [Eumeta japonica]
MIVYDLGLRPRRHHCMDAYTSSTLARCLRISFVVSSEQAYNDEYACLQLRLRGLVLVWSLLAAGGDAASSLGRELQGDIAAIKQPIDETIAFVGSSQCENVKKIVGVAYEQLDREKEPDVNKLSLVFRSAKLKVVYNITYAAEALPADFEYAPGSKFVVFVHGFTDDPYSQSFGNISDAFLKTGGPGSDSDPVAGSGPVATADNAPRPDASSDLSHADFDPRTDLD